MIDATDVDPCRLIVETRTGKPQVWFCHVQCFKSKIVENPYMDLSPAHFLGARSWQPHASDTDALQFIIIADNNETELQCSGLDG